MECNSMFRDASGTSWQPDSTPMEGIHHMYDPWMTMWHGYVDAIYNHQGGDRGDDKIYSASMGMFMTQREMSNGTFGFHSMISLEPLMGKEGYPLLLQTGETADGVTPLIDRQHPHDLFMELAVTYSINISDESSVFGYVGLPGEPVLGPPAFMHRASGVDIPDAPVTHHWMDSTHITYGVLTAGYIWKNMKVEASGFRGREPDQSRWDIEAPAIDSYSFRGSYNPTENWALQVSYGRIHSPEQLEPEVDVKRTTASLIYNKPFSDGNWATTFAWGLNENTPGKQLGAFLLESELRLHDMHTFFGRTERVQKDELFPDGDPLEGEKFTVNKFSVGYIFDIPAKDYLQWGLGGEYSIDVLPDDLDDAYGKTPESYLVFIRAKLI